jgi:hypothetical protein
MIKHRSDEHGLASLPDVPEIDGEMLRFLARKLAAAEAATIYRVVGQ